MSINVAVCETFLNSLLTLEKKDRKAINETIKKISIDEKSSSLSIHKLERIKCDKNFRTARVNRDLRIILAIKDEKYVLLYVDHHDKAYDWCDGKYLSKTNFGADYVYDEKVYVREEIGHRNESEYTNDIALLETNGIKEKDLLRLGIPSIHANNLARITNEDELLEYIGIFPEELQEAIIDLTTNTKNIDEVIDVLNSRKENSENSNVDFESKDSRRRFYTPESLDELEVLIENADFEKWSIFLHPSQEKLVKSNFSGPVLVEGGPGTGKTIVGIHRATYLAENVYKAEDGKKILICTYSKKLANYISEKLDVLMKNKNITNNVEVTSVDSLIYKVLKKNNIRIPKKGNNELDELINDLYEEISPKGTKDFYYYEYYGIIEKNNIKSLDEYLVVDRSGTGMPLQKSARTTAWRFFEKLLEEKEKRNICTFVNKAQLLIDSINEGKIKLEYDSIIIDEAQDLEVVKLQALCKSVRTEKNNIMILSDVNQRIFKMTSWKKDAGINVVGRTYYLSINYRTTKQISDYAMCQFIESEMALSHIKEYKSIMNGNEPLVVGCSTHNEQDEFVIKKVKEFLELGYNPYQIGIICTTNLECEKIKQLLVNANIDSLILANEIYPKQNNGVCICTTMGVKGLEFEAVIVYNYTNIGANRLKNKTSEKVIKNITKLIECEKYVATTRGREELVILYIEQGEDK